jgi:beta-glucosidase
LLKNDEKVLPLKGQPKIFIRNMDPAIAGRFAEVVATPDEADFAIFRLATPWIPVDTTNPFALSFYHGDLDFKEEAKTESLTLLRTVPTIVVFYLDRPAVIQEISDRAKAPLGGFGAGDESVLEVLFGRTNPEGKPPFELHSSMEVVRKQKSDLPHDSEIPLYTFGFGLIN